MFNYEEEISDRKLSQAVLMQALEIEEEQGFDQAKSYYDILLNTLGIYFHNQRRVKEFMFNRLNSAFDYLESLILMREDDIIKYHDNNINNKTYLEAITMEHEAAQNRLHDVLNTRSR